MNAEKEELTVFLDEVIVELKKRERRLVRIEQEIESLKYKLKEYGSQSGILSGNTQEVICVEALKKELRKQLEQAIQVKEEAEEDVKKASERKKLLEEELIGLNNATGKSE